MKKRILSFGLSLVLALSLAVPAFAAESEGSYYTVDVQDLLDGNELDPAALEQMIEAQLGQEYPWMLNWPRKEEKSFSLIVNGQNYDAEIIAGDGITYARADTLNAILGTSLTGDTVAIRAAAEAAGWDVTWNERKNQVVLLDRGRLQRGVVINNYVYDENDKPQWVDYFEYDFSGVETLIARLLSAAQPETKPGQSYRTTNTYEWKLTAFNSLDGDKTYSLRVNIETLTRDNVVEVTLTLNAADVLKVLPQNVLNELAAQLPKVTYQNLAALLTGCKARFILNLDEGMLYWNVPLLAILDDTITENTWGAVDLGFDGADLAALRAAGQSILDRLQREEWHIGDWLYDSLLENSATDWAGAEDAYTDFLNTYSALGLFFGDETVSERGGTLTWHLTAQRANAAFQSLLAQMSYNYKEVPDVDIFKEFDLKISVARNGQVTMEALYRPNMEALAQLEADPWDSPVETTVAGWLMGLLDCRYAAKVSGNTDRTTGTVEFHWKNQLKLTMDSSITRRAVNTPPLSAPPADAEVVELY